MLSLRQPNDEFVPIHARLLILGKSACGKDALRRELEHRGLVFVKSFTTRPARRENEDTHTFVTEEQADEICKASNIIAETTINGYRYFASSEQLDTADAYIIDPKGTHKLAQAAPETPLYVVYLYAEDDARRSAAIARADDKDEAARVFDDRSKDEASQFDEFEKMIASLDDEDTPSNIPQTMVIFEQYRNDYTQATLSIIADSIISNLIYYENIARFIDFGFDMNIFDVDRITVERHVLPYRLDAHDNELTEFMRRILALKLLPVLEK